MRLGPVTGAGNIRIGWLRVFGFGFGWKDTRMFPLVFSEREGHRHVFMVGNWAFTPLAGYRTRRL